MGDGQLEHEAASQGPGDGGRPDHAHHRTGTEIDRHRHVVEEARRLDQGPGAGGQARRVTGQHGAPYHLTPTDDGGVRARVAVPPGPQTDAAFVRAGHRVGQLDGLAPERSSDSGLVLGEILREPGDDLTLLAAGCPPPPSIRDALPQGHAQRPCRSHCAQEEKGRLMQDQRRRGASDEAGHDGSQSEGPGDRARQVGGRHRNG